LLGGDLDSGGSSHDMVELEPLAPANRPEPGFGVNLQAIQDGR